MTEFELARPNHNKLLEIIENTNADVMQILNNLLSYLPDDKIGKFMKDNELDYVDDANSKLDEYFESVDLGYGWVTFEKAKDDLSVEYDLDYINDKMLEEYAKKNFYVIKEYEEGKVIIVNESIDFELDVLPELGDK